MEYVCKVGTPAGDVVERTFVAADEAALRADLEQQGYYLFGIRRGLRLTDIALRRRRISPVVLLIFGQELAALLKAGLPLYQSLDVMLERQKDPVFRASLAGVREKVRAGVSLSDAFKAEADLYPPMFAASLVAGERSGSLETVLRRFVQYMRMSQSLRKKAITAAIYPMLILTMMLGMAGVLLLFVIPKFQDFYEGMGADLPLITRALLGLAHVLASNLAVIVRRDRGGCHGLRRLAPSRRERRRPGPALPADPLRGRHDADVRDEPARPYPFDAPRRRAPLDRRTRGRHGLHRE